MTILLTPALFGQFTYTYTYIYKYTNTCMCIYNMNFLGPESELTRPWQIFWRQLFWGNVHTCTHTAQEASWRRVFDPYAPLLFNLYHYLEQNLHFGLVPEIQFWVSRGRYKWTGSTPALFKEAFRADTHRYTRTHTYVNTQPDFSWPHARPLVRIDDTMTIFFTPAFLAASMSLMVPTLSTACAAAVIWKGFPVAT